MGQRAQAPMPVPSAGALGTRGARLGAEREEEDHPSHFEAIKIMKWELRAMRSAIRRDVHRRLEQEGRETATLTSFVDRTFATVAAMFSAMTFYMLLHSAVRGGDKGGLCVRALYALLVSLLNPLIGCAMQGSLSKPRGWVRDQAHLIKCCLPFFLAWAWKDLTQDSIKYIEEATQIKFFPALAVAVLFLVVIGLAEVTPCYARASKVLNEEPANAKLWMRFAVQPGHIGLAVGYAWNLVLSWPKAFAIERLDTPLFKVMVQVVYCIAITGFITTATMWWSGLLQRKAEQEQQRREEVSNLEEGSAEAGGDAAGAASSGAAGSASGEAGGDALGAASSGAAGSASGEADAAGSNSPGSGESTTCGGSGAAASSEDQVAGGSGGCDVAGTSATTAPTSPPEAPPREGEPAHEEEQLHLSSIETFLNEIEVAATHVLMNAFGFVYGWALLDTINTIFFSYLLACNGPKECSYQSNLAFSLMVTLVFTKIASVLNRKVRKSAVDRAFSNLFNNALALNVGWSWMNFCRAAIQSAGELAELHILVLHLLWFAFIWFSMTFLHHRFHVVKRSWDQESQRQAGSYGISFQ